MLIINTVEDMDIVDHDESLDMLSLGAINIAWKPEVIMSLISKDLMSAMGMLEYLSFTTPGNLTFYSELKERRDLPNPLSALSAWQHDLHLFFVCLWLIRDNSINIGIGFVSSVDTNGEPVFSSNYKAGLNLLCDGSRSRVGYSIDDLSEALRLYTALERVTNEVYLGTFPQTVPLKSQVQPMGRLISAKDVKTLTRLIFFLSAARSHSDLAAKIAMYVTCLELLFTNDAAELSHKLAERVAFFLAGSKEEKLNTFRLVKSLYSIRSKLVHGADLSKGRIETAADSAAAADGLMRRILLRILENERLVEVFESKAGVRESYFEELLFS